MKGLAIKDVAERTGIAAGTIRMWEQRYGFPEPERTTAGYRLYSEDDVEALRRVLALRERGLSVPAAVERVRGADMAHRPAVAVRRALGRRRSRSARSSSRKRTLLAISRAIEDETMSRAASPVVFGAFQRERNYRAVEHRYRAMARTADAVVVFADFDAPAARAGEIAEVPLEAGDALGNEWAVVIDAPGYSACLLAWERRALGRARARPRAHVRDAVDARPARWCAARREVGGVAGAPRRRRARRAHRGRCWPSARWRWSIRRRR